MICRECRETRGRAGHVLRVQQHGQHLASHVRYLVQAIAQYLLNLRTDEDVRLRECVVDIGQRRCSRDHVVGEVLLPAKLLRKLTGFQQSSLLEVDCIDYRISEQRKTDPRQGGPARQNGNADIRKVEGRKQEPRDPREQPCAQPADQRAEQDRGVEGDEWPDQRKGNAQHNRDDDYREAYAPAQRVLPRKPRQPVVQMQ